MRTKSNVLLPLKNSVNRLLLRYMISLSLHRHTCTVGGCIHVNYFQRHTINRVKYKLILVYDTVFSELPLDV